MKILICEDEPDICEIMLDTLLAEKLFTPEEILSTGDGREGLALYRQHRPQIVVTDLIMPGLSGADLIREIRRESHDTSIVVITGHGDNETATALVQYEVDTFFSKPFHFSEIVRVLRRIRERRESAGATVSPAR